MLKRFASTLISLTIAITFSARSAGASSKREGQRIQEALFITLGGLDQWITIRGDNDAAPVLLLLHGGPGDVQSLFAESYKAYEANFILVQWDQRGAGKTYSKYKEQTPNLTLDQLTNDGIELATYLKNRFKREGIIVLGHSLGTAIATDMVTRRPDLFLAYVGTGQIASWAESVQWQFNYLKMKASEVNDRELVSELTKIGTPDPNNTTQYFHFTRTLRNHLDSADAAWLGGLRVFVQNLAKNELDDMAGGMNLSGRTLLPFQLQEKLSTASLDFRVPYYVIQGREDLFTPTQPAIDYFNKVKANKKQIQIIEHAGHFALVTHSSEFIDALCRVLSMKRKYP